MFGWFARKTREPTIVELTSDVEIEASCMDVFASLDLRSGANRYRVRGWRLSEVTGEAGTFHGVNPEMPELEFYFTEQERAPGERLVLSTRFGEGVVVGSVMKGVSRYTLTPLGEGRCHVELKETTTLVAGLTKKRLGEEHMMLAIAVNDDLMRLKALIEEGADAASKAGALDELLEALNATHAA